jgi:16S rRNA (uracil1498-N3)-methyltransferase
VPRFFVPASDITGDQAVLRGTEFRHLQRVLRLREGDHVTLFDDAGREHAGVILSLSPRVAVVRITVSTVPARESPLAITLYQAIPKGRKMDLVIEKAAELGVHAIVPFMSAFCMGTAAGAAGKHERWQRIALAAAKQSGRTSVPTIATPGTFAEAIASAAHADLRLLFFEGAGTSPLAAVPDPPSAPLPVRSATAAVVIGPEGGFSREEVGAASDAGFLILGIGPRILRTETAALVAVTLVQERWGDLGRPAATQPSEPEPG